MKTRHAALVAAILACGSLAGCGAPPEEALTPGPDASTVDVASVSDPAPYYDLGLGLLQNVEAEDGNSLVSPVSLARPLALLATGAEGATRTQIEDVLGVAVDGTLETELKGLADGWSADGDTFSLADSLWVNETFEPAEQFIANAQNDFGAEVYDRAFDDATLGEINGWVDERTHGMIDSILERIDPSYALYVIDACAFEGGWETPYEEGTVEEATFTSEDGTEARVDMMYEQEASGYLENAQCTGFMKPYAGGRYAFVALLPKEGTSVSELLAETSGSELAELVRMGSQGTVNTGLPKFDGSYDMDLSGTLQRLGITDAFDPQLANFSGISPERLCVGEAVQKTFIEVNEEGTKAGAATEVGIEETSMAPDLEEPHEVVLDRPFAYLIVDVTANVPLFMGTVGSID